MVSEFHKRVLSLLLALTIALTGTGCGALVTQSGPEPVTQIGQVDVSKGKVTKKTKKVIDYSTDRFSIGGINAFYILPGLENIPDAMAEFKVIDYNSRGEFVYYYVTPCYMKPEELTEYNSDAKKTGTVKDRSAVTVPEGRREDYEYDAAVLMKYNPGTGEYRVLYANAFQIDKENEFDPATEDRPYYYLAANITESRSYRIFIQQRILCCKVGASDEYFLMDQGSLTGMVFDTDGNRLKTISYMNTLDNEISPKKDALEEMIEDAEDEGEDDKKKLSDEEFAALENPDEEEDEVDPDTMNVLITDVVINDKYESFLGTMFFMGGDLFRAMPSVISSTYMVYRQSLNAEDDGEPYLSVNLRAQAQAEKWMSLDGRFFQSYEELTGADGYSMEGIKTGEYGAEYRDSFSPFIYGSGSQRTSFLVGMPYYIQIPGTMIDKEYAQSVFDTYVERWHLQDSRYDYSPSVFWWVEPDRREGTVDRWKGIVWGGDNEHVAKVIIDEDFGYYIRDDLDIGRKRAIQTMASNVLTNKMNEVLRDAISIDDAIAYFDSLHFLPRPGRYDRAISSNRAPSGFDTADGEDSWLCYRSDHIFSMVSSNDASRFFLSPVDYFPENADSEDDVDGMTGLKMETWQMTPSLNRTVYVHDTNAADAQIREMKQSANLSDDASRAVDELSLLMRTSPDIWNKVKLGWFISQVTGDMGSVLKTVSEDAAKANDRGRLSDSDYEKAMKLLERVQNDIEQRDAHDVFTKAREDARKQRDDGNISGDEYDDIVKAIDKAEQEKLGLNDEDWEMFEKLVSSSRLISEAQNALVSSNGVGKSDMLSRIEELSRKIPEDIREGMLYLCAGFRVIVQQSLPYPIAYSAVFPEGASFASVNGQGNETTGGRIDAHRDGVIISAESTGEWFEGNTFMIGYRDAGNMELFNRYTYGSPIDISSMEFRDGDRVRSIIVLLTDKGAKFLERNEANMQTTEYSFKNLKRTLGDYEGERFYESLGWLRDTDGFYEWARNKDLEDQDFEMKNAYTPLPFDQRGNEAYESAKAETELQEKVNEDDFKGFLTNRMLVTSTGYTRDTEKLLEDAIKSGIARATASENQAGDTGGEQVDTSGSDKNDRYTGHLNSSRNICMIDWDKALICSVTGGTKILDLNHGTVADDMEGSYYRAYQRGNSKVFSVLGFASTDFSYLDVDLPMAKIYTLNYENGGLDKAVADSFMNMLDQYAKDYLYREYRTVLTDSGEIERKEATEAEKRESVEAGAIFDPDNTDYESALSALEKKYGIESTPPEIRDYTVKIRERIAAVRPAMTKIFELAGATRLAADTAKRSEGYWKSVESRMTMAENIDFLGDILVEIRMNDEVLQYLPKDQADKYRSYRKVIDYTKEHTKVSANDIFAEGDLRMKNSDAVEKRQTVTYRNDVLQDIVNEYASLSVSKNASGNYVEITEAEKRKAFDDYLSVLLDQVNPENYMLDKERAADEFVNIINHGRGQVSGAELEAMRGRIKDGLPSVDTTWKLEELILREKIENEGAYSEYRQWLQEYDDRINAGANDTARLKIPVKGGNGSKNEQLTPLSGDERISFLRTSAAYRAIIGELKSDDTVREYLAVRKETWDDYCKEVVRTAGMRVVKDQEPSADDGAEDGQEKTQ